MGYVGDFRGEYYATINHVTYTAKQYPGWKYWAIGVPFVCAKTTETWTASDRVYRNTAFGSVHQGTTYYFYADLTEQLDAWGNNSYYRAPYLIGTSPEMDISTTSANVTYVRAEAFPVGSYTVTYNGNGGTNVPASQTKYYGVDLTLSNQKPTRTGYNFEGWYKEASCVNKFSETVYKGNENLTLYAKWSGTIIYEKNSTHTVTNMPASQAKPDDKTVYLSNNIPVSTDIVTDGGTITLKDLVFPLTSTYSLKNTEKQSFKYWKGPDLNYMPGDAFQVNGTSTMKAQWDTTTVKSEITLPIRVKDNCTFVGWTQASVHNYGDSNTYTGQYTPATTDTFYAIWRPVPVTHTLLSYQDAIGMFNSWYDMGKWLWERTDCAGTRIMSGNYPVSRPTTLAKYAFINALATAINLMLANSWYNDLSIDTSYWASWTVLSEGKKISDEVRDHLNDTLPKMIEYWTTATIDEE